MADLNERLLEAELKHLEGGQSDSRKVLEGIRLMDAVAPLRSLLHPGDPDLTR